MAENKSGTIALVLVAVLALLAGLGGGYMVSQSCSAEKNAAAPETQAPAPATAKTVKVDVDTDQIAGQVIAALDKKLDDRLAELAALERLKSKATAPAAKAEAVKPAPAPAAAKQPEQARVAPRPAPGKPPTPPAVKPEGQKETSAKALEMRAQFKTESGASPAIGPDTAPVKVYIISDFQCPVCKRAAEGCHGLFDEFGDQVQWIFWQNPLDMHRKALPTAKASMAAFMQGKFWEYHDKLFQNQRASDAEDLLRYAVDLGLDMDKFKADMESEELLKKIRSDQAAAEKLGARGTPAFVVNGRVQVGWGSAAGIGSMVRREQKEMKNLMDSGKSLEEARAERGKANAKNPESATIYLDHFLAGKPAARDEEAKK